MKATYKCLLMNESRGHLVYDFIEKKRGSFSVGTKKLGSFLVWTPKMGVAYPLTYGNAGGGGF